MRNPGCDVWCRVCRRWCKLVGLNLATYVLYFVLLSIIIVNFYDHSSYHNVSVGPMSSTLLIIYMFLLTQNNQSCKMHGDTFNGIYLFYNKLAIFLHLSMTLLLFSLFSLTLPHCNTTTLRAIIYINCVVYYHQHDCITDISM